MAERICRVCSVSDYRNLELTGNYGLLLKETFKIDISSGDRLCAECWNSVARVRVLKLIGEQALVQVNDHNEKCATCKIPVGAGCHHLGLTENLVLWLKNILNIEFTTDNQLCEACWNMVVKLRKLQLMIKQPHGTLYGHFTNLMCRFCQTIGNHEKLPGDSVLLLNEILDIDISSNDLVCVTCSISVGEIRRMVGVRVKERPPNTCRPVGLVVPQLDNNDVPMSPIGAIDRFLANIPTPMLSEHSSIAAPYPEAPEAPAIAAASPEAPSITASSPEASFVAVSSAGSTSDDAHSNNVTSTSSRYVRRKKKSKKASSLYKQSLLNMLKKATK